MNRNTSKKIISEGSTNIGGPFRTDLENGPKNHGSRALGNWQSDNAWDVFAPAGSVVNSYTNGTVKKVRDTGKNSGKIYGTQVTVSGTDGFPEIFYTHLKDVKLSAGDKVKVGDRIGVVSEWVGHDKMTHVHIGLPFGKHLRDLLKNSKSIFSGKSNEIETDDFSDDEKKDDTDKKIDFGSDADFQLFDLGPMTDFFKGIASLKKESVNEDVVRIKEIMKKVL